MQATTTIILCSLLYVNAQEIISFKQEPNHIENGEEIYRHTYSTSNGIERFEEVHVPQGENPDIRIYGNYYYTAPDGKEISVFYFADKDGFKLVPGGRGEAQPQPRPQPTPQARPQAIPDYVLKSMIG